MLFSEFSAVKCLVLLVPPPALTYCAPSIAASTFLSKVNITFWSLLNLLVLEFYGIEAVALKVSVQEVLLCLMSLTVCFLWVAMFVFLHQSKLQDGVTQSS